jgi:anti-sigma factor RsiW
MKTSLKSSIHLPSVCRHTREHFSGYLDGLVSGKVMQQIAAHLQICNDCEQEFAGWRATQSLLGSMGPAKAPEDLALRLRVALSQAAAQTPKAAVDRWRLQWADVYRPFALRATAGLASALCLTGTVAMLVGMFAAPQRVEARDEPLAFASGPRFLYSSMEPDETIGDPNQPVIIEAFVNDAGRVYDYQVISGTMTSAVRAQLNNTLLFSQFEPARSFGEPVRGTVVMSFSGVDVKG